MGEPARAAAITPPMRRRERPAVLALVAVAAAALTYVLHHLPPLEQHAVEVVLVVVASAALLVLVPVLAEDGRHHPLLPVVLVAGPDERTLRPATERDVPFSAALQARALDSVLCARAADRVGSCDPRRGSMRPRPPATRGVVSSGSRRVSTVALVLGLISVLAFRMTPADGHFHTVDLLVNVVPQLLAAIGAASALRWVARRSGLPDGALQSTAVLLAGLGAFELVGVGLDATHATGVHGLIEHGGWAAVPVALGLGSAIGLLTCAATAQIRRLAAARTPRQRRTAARPAQLPTVVLVPSGALIARNLAGRAPPALSR